jgi:hypothetical protein
MVGTRDRFVGGQAPCGRTVAGEHYRDTDEQGLVIIHDDYECGCREIRHEFHDGSIHNRVIRHDGRTVSDEDHGT